MEKNEMRRFPVKDLEHEGLNTLQLLECISHVRLGKSYKKLHYVSDIDIFTMGYVPYVKVEYKGNNSNVIIINRVDHKFTTIATFTREEFLTKAEDCAMFARY